MSEKEWLRSVTVCESLDKQWYVTYATQQCYFRLTHRGTWSMDDMDIYWKSQAEAFAALHVAPCPLEDPYKRIAELEEALKVMGKAFVQLRGALRLDAMVDDDGVYFGTTTVALQAASGVADNTIASDAIRKNS